MRGQPFYFEPPEERNFVTINGYHATSRQNLESIMQNGFFESQNDEDWLGDGTYFWQDAPERAWTWAREDRQRRGSKIGENPIVIGAKILLPLDEVVDLFGSRWMRRLNQKYWQLMAELVDANPGVEELERIFRQSLDVERPNARRLDRLVMNSLVADLVNNESRRVVAVRASFPEGAAIYPESGFRRNSHVQVAVREKDFIDPPDTIGKRFGLWQEPEPV